MSDKEDRIVEALRRIDFSLGVIVIMLLFIALGT
jgi:hypothetical protein